METKLTLDQIQQHYERYEAHTGIQAIQRAIDKVLVTGKYVHELGNGDISRTWINSNFEVQYNDLIEMRNGVIDREFSDIKQLLQKI